MHIAEKAVRAIRQEPADLVASDCPLAGLQLDQAGASAHVGGKGTLHPIQSFAMPTDCRNEASDAGRFVAA